MMAPVMTPTPKWGGMGQGKGKDKGKLKRRRDDDDDDADKLMDPDLALLPPSALRLASTDELLAEVKRRMR